MLLLLPLSLSPISFLIIGSCANFLKGCCMEVLFNLLQGFHIATEPLNLLFCFLGVLIGTLIGVLPGIGPTATVALLLPITFSVTPVSAIILLAGVYYGSMYGGSTTSILVNLPGESASIVTCLDGYQMAKEGRAGPALGIAAFGSFIAGTIGLFGLVWLALPLARAALKMGPPEYFTLMCLGIIVLIFMARGSMVKSLIMATVGLVFSFIGIDVITGRPRFTFGVPPEWKTRTPPRRLAGSTIRRYPYSASVPGSWPGRSSNGRFRRG